MDNLGNKITEINVEELDREEALLLYKGKMYFDGNHQFAYARTLRDEGITLDYDLVKKVRYVH